MNHKKGYKTAAEAWRSKAAGFPGAVIVTDCRICPLVHVDRPKAAAVPAQRGPVALEAAPRAKPGAMKAAVVLVVYDGINLAQAARDLEVDPERLEVAAEKAWRAACLERDHYTCQCCGAQAEQVQHRVARGSGGTSDSRIAFGLANGVSMTAECHRIAETRDQAMHDRGFWLNQKQDPADVPVLAATEYGTWEIRWLLPSGGVSITDPKEEAAA